MKRKSLLRRFAEIRRKLVYKQTRNVVVASLLIGFVADLYQIHSDWRVHRSTLESNIRQVIGTVIQPAAKAAFYVDTELADEVNRGLMEYQAIVDVRIADDLGHVLAESRRERAQGPFRWLSDWAFGRERAFELVLKDTEDATVRVGTLSVIADPYAGALEFFDRSMRLLLLGLVKSAVLGLLLSVMFYYLLMRPILSLAAALGSVDPDNPDQTRLAVPHHNRADELHDLAEAGNDLLRSIGKRISERNRAEAQLRQAAENLERRIEERTAELQVETSKAEEANRAKSEFLAQMSHELRSPLNSIMGYAELALTEEAGRSLPKSIRGYVEVISRSGKYLQDLIGDILDLSRIEAGQLSLEHAPFDLPQTVREVIDVMTAPARERGNDLSLDMPDDMPRWMNGDQVRIRQILINLLSNAIKFTEDGGILVAVACQPVGGEKVRLRCAVSDSGIGIASDKQHHLFEAFAQADSSITREYGGSGLGLSICKQLLFLMGGEIGMESTLGKGSTFWFEITLDRSTARQSGDADDPDEIAVMPLKILLAEDIELNRLMACKLLEQRGHQIVQAANGREAVECLLAEDFDVILMDIHMPELDGIGATKEIRALEDKSKAGIPIIALTADVSSDNVMLYRQAGMNEHCPKPMDMTVLSAILKRVTQGRPAALAAGANPVQEGSPELADLPEGAQLLDLDRFREMLTILPEGMEMFARQSDMTMVQLRDALRNGDTQQAADVLHAMKGVARNMGFTLLATLCQELETAVGSPDGGLAALEQKLGELEETLAETTEQAGPLAMQAD